MVHVVRRHDRKVLGLLAAHVRYELLSPDLHRQLDFVRMEADPGQVMPTVGWSPTGEESILIVEGAAHLQYGTNASRSRRATILPSTAPCHTCWPTLVTG